MTNKTLNLITGLPRSGGSVVASILSQNPALQGDANSHLPHIITLLHQAWQGATDIAPEVRRDVMRGVIQGYYQSGAASTVFAKSLAWVPMIPLLESVLDTQLKIIVCVRNPAEILTSLERSRLQDPMHMSEADIVLKDKSNLSSRCFFYASPEGILGSTHTHLKDAVIKGYLDRMLFVDYGLFCGSPRSQTERIYDFFELPEYQHDFQNIPTLVKGVRPELQKTGVNCVQYIGLDLFEQFNSQIFWNAWV